MRTTVEQKLEKVGGNWTKVRVRELVGMVTCGPYRRPVSGSGSLLVGVSALQSCQAAEELLRRPAGVRDLLEILALGAQIPSMGHAVEEEFGEPGKRPDENVSKVLLENLHGSDAMRQHVCRVICQIEIPDVSRPQYLDVLSNMAQNSPAYDTGRNAVEALVHLKATRESFESLPDESVPHGARRAACRVLGVPEPQALGSMNIV